MAGFFNKLKSASGGPSLDPKPSTKGKKEKEEPPPELTPLEKMIQNAGALRDDGKDKFFGLENFGNTCYCNSIVQALYYTDTFRENVVNYPRLTPSETPDGKKAKVNVTIRPPMAPGATTPAKEKLTAAQTLKQRQAINAGQVPPIRPEDRPDSPEYKKKQAMIKGPVLELAQENTGAYGMDECTFTGLKDIFSVMMEANARTGVLSPQRFLDIFKRDNEMFRNSMHQDAHEFYGLVLNDVISNVETNAKRVQERDDIKNKEGLARSVETALGAATALAKGQTGTRSPGTKWVHDIFEGVLTSETKCSTCETTSQRDETFLDLSIDLEEHSSVTACLTNFSAEEMLCERNKFYCDHCGGLQEAEKRMKIKQLPKVLALHLKRFKYTEDYSRLQKLFHRCVYPYYLRMFNTTDEAEDPDRMYELYAVVVHIGGNAYHGHYVSIIKTPDRGWLLFDDEMVEPVDKHFVKNFFGDKPGMACAYVLFYQETTFEKMREQQVAEGMEEVRLATQTADLALESERPNGSTSPLTRLSTQPISPVIEEEPLVSLNHAQTAPDVISSPVVPVQVDTHPLVAAPPPVPNVATSADLASRPAEVKSKDDREREKKELKAQEKARKLAEKEQKRQLEEQQKREDSVRLQRQIRIREAQKSAHEDYEKAIKESKALAAEEEKKRKAEAATREAGASPTPSPGSGFLNRANRGSKSLSRKSFGILGKRSEDGNGVPPTPTTPAAEGSQQNGNGNGNSHAAGPQTPEIKPLKERFSFGLGRKRSEKFSS